MKTKAPDEGKAVMIGNLSDAIEMESHLQLCYHVEHRYWKFRKFPLHAKFHDFGEDVEGWQEKLFSQSFRLGKGVQYDSGSINSPEPDAPPADTLVTCLKNLLDMESEISLKFEDFCIQAWEARDDEMRNLYEHLIKWHHAHEQWLKAKVQWADELGAKDFAASELAQG